MVFHFAYRRLIIITPGEEKKNKISSKKAPKKTNKNMTRENREPKTDQLINHSLKKHLQKINYERSHGGYCMN